MKIQTKTNPRNLGGCGQAFEVVIVSNIFIGKNKLLRHRLVNKALRDEIMSIHAFTQVS